MTDENDDDEQLWDEKEFEDEGFVEEPDWGEELPEEDNEENPWRAEDFIQQTSEFAGLRDIVEGGTEHYERLAAIPARWVWQDYAPEGGVVVLAGKSGEGKTSLLFALLCARATVTQKVFICERRVMPIEGFKRALLIEGEHSSRSTARKLVKTCDLLDLPHTVLDRILSISRKSVIINDARWKLIENLVALGAISDLAIDTLARCSPKNSDSNDEQSQIAVFDALTLAIERAPEPKPTVWILAHTRKSPAGTPGGEGGSLDSVSGSLQRVGQADSVIGIVGKRDNGQMVGAEVSLLKAREEPENYPATCDFVLGAPTEIGEEDDDGIDFAEVRGLFEQDPSITVRDAAKAAGISKSAAARHLKMLKGV